MTSHSERLANLRATRASLEAFALMLEKMEADAARVASTYRAAAKRGRQWTQLLVDGGVPEPEIKSEGAASSLQASGLQDRKRGKANPVRVLLASESKNRRELIESILPSDFALVQKFISPSVDEKSIRHDDPKQLVLGIAQLKMKRSLELLDEMKFPLGEEPQLVVCADQVVLCKDTIYEKPESPAQAKEHLQSYYSRKAPATCVAGVVVANRLTGERFFDVNVAKLHFARPVPDGVVDLLVAKGDIMKSAGSFVIEDPLLAPYLGEREGEVESIRGMPRELTRRLLESARATLKAEVD